MKYRQWLERHKTKFTLIPQGADMFEKVRARRKQDRRHKQLAAMPFCMDCIRSQDRHILAVNIFTDGRGERISVCAEHYKERTGGQ